MCRPVVKTSGVEEAIRSEELSKKEGPSELIEKKRGGFIGSRRRWKWSCAAGLLRESNREKEEKKTNKTNKLPLSFFF